MFAHTCTACCKRRLNFADQITGMDSTDHGIVVTFTCWCGAEQTMTTGVRAAPPAPAPAVPVAA